MADEDILQLAEETGLVYSHPFRVNEYYGSIREDVPINEHLLKFARALLQRQDDVVKGALV